MIGLAAAAAGMVIFAWCSHQAWPWAAASAGGLVLTAVAIARTPFAAVNPSAMLGLGRLTPKAVAFSAVGVALGIGAGLTHRNALGLPLQPTSGVEWFVIAACLIGATEELLYRGWLLGRALTYGWPAAIVVAAAAHAAYKTALFAWPAVPAPIDLASLAVVTLLGGLVLGALRVLSGSLVPAVLAHVAFDFVVYRAVAHAPWWVWG